MTPSIVIFGGGGFLGSRISRAAVTKGWHVTSVSRSPPPLPPPPSDDGDKEGGDGWKRSVEWITGDAFDPASYRAQLARADHVVHTIGLLDYRGVRREVRGHKMLDKVGLTLRDSLFLPLLGGEESPELKRYDRYNTDALVQTAGEAARHDNIKSFTYVSTAGHFPGIPRRYVESKRRAEQFLLSLPATTTTRKVILRPGFMYDDDDAAGPTKSIARVLGLTYALNSAASNRLGLGAAGVKPLSVDRVGAAVVEAAAADDRVSGIVDTHGIEALADVRWRHDML